MRAEEQSGSWSATCNPHRKTGAGSLAAGSNDDAAAADPAAHAPSLGTAFTDISCIGWSCRKLALPVQQCANLYGQTWLNKLTGV